MADNTYKSKGPIGTPLHKLPPSKKSNIQAKAPPVIRTVIEEKQNVREIETLELENKNIRYTIGQVFALNHGRAKVPPHLEEIFNSYTTQLSFDYNNKSNVRLATDAESKRRKPILTKNDDVYNDASILSHLRHAFGSVAKGKTTLPIAQLNQTVIPPTMVMEVSKLFLDTMIQCPMLCDEFLVILFSIEYISNIETKIYGEFVKNAMQYYSKPLVLEDSKLESGEDRTKNHHTSVCLLIAKLFAYEFNQSEKHKNPRMYFSNRAFLDKFLEPLFQKMEAGDAQAVNNLASVWNIIKVSPKFNDLGCYIERMRAVYASKLFKLSIKLLIKDHLV